MEDCLEEVKRAAETITYNHPHRRFIEIILCKCPEAMRENIRPCTMDDFQDYEDEGAPKQRMDVPSEKTLGITAQFYFIYVLSDILLRQSCVHFLKNGF